MFDGEGMSRGYRCVCLWFNKARGNKWTINFNIVGCNVFVVKYTLCTDFTVILLCLF